MSEPEFGRKSLTSINPSMRFRKSGRGVEEFYAASERYIKRENSNTICSLVHRNSVVDPILTTGQETLYLSHFLDWTSLEGGRIRASIYSIGPQERKIISLWFTALVTSPKGVQGAFSETTRSKIAILIP